MANWRRKALALFPELRNDVQRPDFSIYMLFFELLPMSRQAHTAGDDELLRRIYGFTEWCFEQKAKDMWNAAGVAFYEHLFDDHPSLWPEVVQWLSPTIVEGVWGLWEWRLTSEELARVKHLIEARRQRRYPEARLTRRCTLADQAMPHRLLLLAVAGSISFTAAEFDPRLEDDPSDPTRERSA